MIKFEIVNAYKDKGINLPTRSTSGSAGYDIEAAEDILVKALKIENKDKLVNFKDLERSEYVTLVPTGLKVKMDSSVALIIYPRSSVGTKLLTIPGSAGIIDSDYYNNESNEGHFYVPLINLSGKDIMIKKGDRIAQGLFANVILTSDDNSEGFVETRTGGFGSTDKSV